MASVRDGMRRYRRPAFIAGMLIAIYALSGFWLAPWIAKRRLPGHFSDLGLHADLERLRTNPFTLTARAEGFVLRGGDGGELLGFDELFVNFQLSSLFRWAWTFKKIRLVNPRIEAILHEDGSLNLAALAPETDPRDEPAAGEAFSLPRVVIHEFEIRSGLARFEDRTRPVPFQTQAGPANFTLEDFSTLPEDSGELAFAAELESGARLTWRGTVGVNPVRSSGRVKLFSASMPITDRYLQDLVRFRIMEGRTDAELSYDFSLEGDQSRITLSDGSIVVSDLAVAEADADVALLRLPELRISGIGMEWPRKDLSVSELALTGARLQVWRNPDGSLNLLEHLPARTEAAEEAGGEGKTAPFLDGWRITMGRLAVEDLGVTLQDRTVNPPFETGLGNLRLEVRDIDNEPGSLFPVTFSTDVDTGGAASAEGRVGVLPGPSVDAAVKVSGLSLIPAQAYVVGLARLTIGSGQVSMEGRLESNAEEILRYRGSVKVADLACRDDRREEKIVGLGLLSAGDTLLELTAARLWIARIELDGLYGRLAIAEDGSTNIGDLLVDAGAESGTSPVPSDLPLAIEIGEVAVRNGSADFADLSLPLPFSSHIDALEGRVSEMASGGTSARVELGGTVDQHGLARIEGSMDLFAPDRRSDVSVAFRNVEMSRLTPYFSKFAGYEVVSGRLSLDLRYMLQDRRLESENEILVDQMTLGKKVDSPDAVNLPVKLAVAMLKDKNGRIELDVPVTGTLDDPQFDYGKLIWTAIKTLMTKIVTAPFVALARLIGSEKDLEFVEFEAAESEIEPPARETLEQLAQALAERPELVLEVRGVFDPEIDGLALRERGVEALVEERIASLTAQEAEVGLSSERKRAALESLFLERFAQEDLDRLLAEASRAPSGQAAGEASPAAAAPGEPVLDLQAYLDSIMERLIEVQVASEEDLARLADDRANALGGFFTAGPLSPGRIRTVESGPIPGKDAGNNWVRLRLVLTSG